MAKSKTEYVCSECGFSAPRWTGQCPSCRSWNTMTEEVVCAAPASAGRMGQAAPAHAGRVGRICELSEVRPESGRRWKTGISEFDRVLGGGVVPGSVVLSGGEPGVGKSTMFLQVAGQLLRHGPVLYVSGEESPSQIRMRAERLRVPGKVHVMAETELNAMAAGIREMKPQFLIVDSIQTLYDENLTSAPGSVSQVRSCAASIARISKETGIPAFIIGHVTKEGMIAGPRVVEHLVDTVLYFEGDRATDLRILRAVKNRFGGTDEIGLFEMRDTGMHEAEQGLVLLGAQDGPELDGVAVYPATQGRRPMLLEIQALCASTQLNNPRRMASGIELNRLHMLCAVLEKKIGFKLFEQDVFLNVTGGIRIRDNAADLAIAMAIVSSLRSTPLPRDTAFIGEIGLSGELRPVRQMSGRLSECSRMGMKHVVVPKDAAKQERAPEGLDIIQARTLFDAFDKTIGTR